MGRPKMDHIRVLGTMPAVAVQWRAKHGREFGEAEAAAVYQRFLPRQVEAAGAFADVIPGVAEAVDDLRDRGIRIPADMAVVGYDEFAWASLLDPPLTVLDEDSEAIGRLAGQTLARIINEQAEAAKDGGSQSPVYRAEDRQQVAGRLIVRRSCGCYVDNERPR